MKIGGDKMKKQTLVIPVVIGLLLLATMPIISSDADKEELSDLFISDYGWDEDNECWDTDERIYENEEFMIRVINHSSSYPYKRAENASVTFINATGHEETKYTDNEGNVFFTAPSVITSDETFQVLASKEGFNNRWGYVNVYNASGWQLVYRAHFTDSEGYTEKFDITTYHWKVEWQYIPEISAKYPYFAFNLYDGHGHDINGVSSSTNYITHGVIYFQGRAEDFFFKVWDANLMFWQIDVYQRDFPD